MIIFKKKGSKKQMIKNIDLFLLKNAFMIKNYLFYINKKQKYYYFFNKVYHFTIRYYAFPDLKHILIYMLYFHGYSNFKDY